MDALTRETRINDAFVAVADTLAESYEEADVLHRLVVDCVDILGMSAGGLMITDPAGELHLLTATTPGAKFVELMALNASSGPCIDCFRSGEAVSVADIRDESARWPTFVATAVDEGFRSVLATPMKVRGTVIGTLNLFGDSVGEVNARDARVAQSLVHVASIAVLQERVISEKDALEEHLQRALESRIAIEQAKGFVASSLGVPMDEAFALLRKYARDRNMTIRSVAQAVAGGNLGVPQLEESFKGAAAG